ncbi:MAG: helix-turn-helix domain-containing protein [Chthonomonadales bacterium]
METLLKFEDLPEILSADEVAAYLRVGRSLVYDAIRDRTIPSIRIGKRFLVPKSGIEKLICAPEQNEER